MHTQIKFSKAFNQKLLLLLTMIGALGFSFQVSADFQVGTCTIKDPVEPPHGTECPGQSLIGGLDFSNAGAGIDLRYADFSTADLTIAIFTNSNLTGANFNGAILTGATFTGAIWDHTICPDGFNSEAHVGQTCEGAYLDTDSDGVTDAADGFPSNPAASIDSDSDGFPDYWDEACDAACQGGSGLTIDQFPYNNAASRDDDHDGFPDVWNTSPFNCNVTCQVNSGLGLDVGLDDAGAIFVDVNTPATYGVDADGLTWSTAWPTLQDALAVVAAGQEIWIAKGVYYPDEVALNNTEAADDSFALVNKTALVGGFAGGESVAADADIESNPVVLSGDIAQDDANVDLNGVHTGFETLNNHGGTNSHRIVSASSVIARLTGLIISGGGSSVSGNESGGGIHCASSELKLERVRMVYNRAINTGGAIYCNNSNTKLVLDEVEIDNNYAGTNGGGIYQNLPGQFEMYHSSVTNNEANGGGGIAMFNGATAIIENSTIAFNTANTGGGIRIQGDGTIDSTDLEMNFSTLAYNDATVADGGGLYLTNFVRAELVGTVITGNTALTSGSESVARTDDDEFAADYSSFGDDSFSGLHLIGSGGVPLNTFLTTPSSTAYVADQSDVDIVDNMLIHLGGFARVLALPQDSSLKNAINEIDCDKADIHFDQRGFPRPYKQQFEGDLNCDIGAVESNDHDLDGASDDVDAFPANLAGSTDIDNDGFPDAWTPGCLSACQTGSGLVLDAGIDAAGAIFVDKNAVGGTYDGATWTTAFQNVEDALADAGTTEGYEIWIARGVYYRDEAVGATNNNASLRFNLKGGVALVGGFAGGETQASQADPGNNAVILSGDIDQNDTNKTNDIHTAYEGANNHNGFNSEGIISCNSQAGLVRLTDISITGGGGSTALSVGGIEVQACNILLQRVGVFFSRSGTALGAGSISFNGLGGYSFRMEDSIIEGGYTASTVEGGGMTLQGGTSEIIRSTISGNIGAGQGGGLRLVDHKAFIENSTIVNNSANEGAGIFVDSTGSISGQKYLHLVLSTVAHNTATSGDGGGIYLGGTGDADIDLQGTVVTGNTATGVGANVYRGTSDEAYGGYSYFGDSGTSGLADGLSDNVSVAAFLTNGSEPTVFINPETVGDTVNSVLVDHGGFTPVLPIPSVSPLRNTIPDFICNDDASLSTDQRGFPRPYMNDPGGDFSCDIGAYELNDYDLDASPDNIDTDDDGDGMDDSFEETYGLNPFNATDLGLDPDGDTLTNIQEFNLGRNPNIADFAEPESELVISPKSYRYAFQFDTATCDSVATPVRYTIKNNDTVSRDITGTITFDNVVNATDWQLKSGNDTCSNTTILSGASCTFDVVFCAPDATGNHAGEINVPTDSVDTPILTSALYNYESDQIEAERRLPPVISDLVITNINAAPVVVTDGRIKSGELHTYEWTITGYHPSYESSIAMFNCFGTAPTTCGSNFSNNIFNSSLMAPSGTAAGTWTYNGIVANTYTYTVNHTLTYNAGEDAGGNTNEYLIRFYRKSQADVQTGNSSLSGMVPGNIMPLNTDYYDTSGRRLNITVIQ